MRNTKVKEVMGKDGEVDKYLINPANSELNKMDKEQVFLELFVYTKIV